MTTTVNFAIQTQLVLNVTMVILLIAPNARDVIKDIFMMNSQNHAALLAKLDIIKISLIKFASSNSMLTPTN